MIEYLASLPPAKLLPFGFAMIWLYGVLCVEGIKTAKTKEWRALFGLGTHIAFWAMGLIFVLEHKTF